DRFGQEIHVLHRHHRVRHPEHAADLVHPVAGGVDHDLAGDIAVLRVHDEFAVRLAGDVFDRVEAMDLGAGGTRAPGQGEAELGGVDVAVERVPPRAEQAGGLDQRVPPADLGGVDELELDADALGHPHEVAVGVDLVVRVGEAQAAGDVVVDGKFGVGRQLAVEVDAVALERHHGLVGAELGDLGRGVPGGTGGQLVALDQHDVAEALAGEVIQGRTAADSPADDDYPGMRFHDVLHWRLPPRPGRRRAVPGRYHGCRRFAPAMKNSCTGVRIH